MTEETFDEKKLGQIYTKVVENANKNTARKGFIKCPVCNEEILMIPTLKVMQEAIENHVQNHKNQMEKNKALTYQSPIFIRLALMKQVIYHVYKKLDI